jgi:hypothetical protein
VTPSGFQRALQRGQESGAADDEDYAVNPQDLEVGHSPHADWQPERSSSRGYRGGGGGGRTSRFGLAGLRRAGLSEQEAAEIWALHKGNLPSIGGGNVRFGRDTIHGADNTTSNNNNNNSNGGSAAVDGGIEDWEAPMGAAAVQRPGGAATLLGNNTEDGALDGEQRAHVVRRGGEKHVEGNMESIKRTNEQQQQQQQQQQPPSSPSQVIAGNVNGRRVKLRLWTPEKNTKPGNASNNGISSDNQARPFPVGAAVAVDPARHGIGTNAKERRDNHRRRSYTAAQTTTATIDRHPRTLQPNSRAAGVDSAEERSSTRQHHSTDSLSLLAGVAGLSSSPPRDPRLAVHTTTTTTNGNYTFDTGSAHAAALPPRHSTTARPVGPTQQYTTYRPPRPPQASTIHPGSSSLITSQLNGNAAVEPRQGMNHSGGPPVHVMPQSFAGIPSGARPPLKYFAQPQPQQQYPQQPQQQHYQYHRPQPQQQYFQQQQQQQQQQSMASPVVTLMSKSLIRVGAPGSAVVGARLSFSWERGMRNAADVARRLSEWGVQYSHIVEVEEQTIDREECEANVTLMLSAESSHQDDNDNDKAVPKGRVAALERAIMALMSAL